MIYITGDTHRDFERIEYFCEDHHTTKDDLMIILGDNGVNYYGDDRDRQVKQYLESLPITFMMIRGNHDMRPSMDSYDECSVYEPNIIGSFLAEREYPHLLFARDFSFYRLNDKTVFVFGGAYSADKPYRLANGFRWFADEQMSKGEMEEANETLKWAFQPSAEYKVEYADIVLSHTCPFQYIPRDKFISCIDQSTVDDTMEHWFDKINEIAKPKKWYCGHWHTDRVVDNMRFMYKDIIELE